MHVGGDLRLRPLAHGTECNCAKGHRLLYCTGTMAGEFRAISQVVALITGAASGLGRATAARLVRQVSIKLHAALTKEVLI